MIEIDCEWMIKFPLFDTISFFHCQNIHVIYAETNEIKRCFGKSDDIRSF